MHCYNLQLYKCFRLVIVTLLILLNITNFVKSWEINSNTKRNVTYNPSHRSYFQIPLNSSYFIISTPSNGASEYNIFYVMKKLLHKIQTQTHSSQTMPVKYIYSKNYNNENITSRLLFTLCLRVNSKQYTESDSLRYPGHQRKHHSEKNGYILKINANKSSLCAVWLTALSSGFFIDGLHRLSREVFLGKKTKFQISADKRIIEYSSEKVARWRKRGHQYTFAHHPSMFRSWSLFDKFSYDLKVFGTNIIEGAHVKKNVDNLLPIGDLIRFSSSLDKLDLNVSFWWPDSLSNMSNLNELYEIFSKSPRINSIFFPGGDGGILNWQVIGTTAEILRKFHPEAGIWVSAQEVDAATFNSFVHDINTNTTIQNILNLRNGGVVYGPHNRLPFLKFSKCFNNQIKIRQYPDICHMFDAQYALKKWDDPFAMSYGRQVVNPAPIFMSEIIELRSNGSTPNDGVGAYSEGLNDDLNKFIWSAMGQDSTLTVQEVVEQYVRYFFTSDAFDEITNGLFGLENNWKGYAHSNKAIPTTLKLFETAIVKLGIDALKTNWRLQMYFRRALMDAYLQRKMQLSLIKEHAVYDVLQSVLVNGGDIDVGISDSMKILNKNVVESDEQLIEWNMTIIDLTNNMLNCTIGNEVLQSQDYFLNLKSFYLSLSDCNYLKLQLMKTLHMKTVAEKKNLLESLLKHKNKNRNDGNIIASDHTKVYHYDFLGGISDSQDHPHLIVGNAMWSVSDPSSYYNPLQMGFLYNPLYPRSWSRYAMTFYDQSLQLKYTGLNSASTYHFKIVYFNDNSNQPQQSTRLQANNVILHDYQEPPYPMAEEIFIIYGQNIIGKNGELIVSCNRKPGVGGNGMTCKICEVTLIEL